MTVWSRNACVAQLRAHGCADAEAKADRCAACEQRLNDDSADAIGRYSLWVPGRVEVFGKHTDYAGGRSLLIAIDRGFCVRVAPRRDARVRVTGCDVASTGRMPDTWLTCEVPLSVTATGTVTEGHWSAYVATVVRRVAMNFPGAHTGADIAFVSDLPQAAGASSSTALMISVFLALTAVNQLDATDVWARSLPTRIDLASYLGAIEMGGPYRELAGLPGVGTLGGCQDQTAILCSRAAMLSEFGWMPTTLRNQYPAPSMHHFVVAASGIVAEKSAGAQQRYNRVSLMVRHLLAEWNAETSRDDASLAAAVQSHAAAADRLRGIIPRITTNDFSAPQLQARLDQFVLETYTLIPAAGAAFAASDWSALGHAAARSQQAAQAALGNQVPETTRLVHLARALGAVAASAFGAGFGGSVWALVPASITREPPQQFLADWEAAYRREFPAAAARAKFFVTSAGPAATAWADDPGARFTSSSSFHG